MLQDAAKSLYESIKSAVAKFGSEVITNHISTIEGKSLLISSRFLMYLVAVNPVTAERLKQTLKKPAQDATDSAGYLQKLQEKYEDAIIEMNEILKLELRQKYEEAARNIQIAVYGADNYDVFQTQKWFRNNSLKTNNNLQLANFAP